MRNLTPYRDSHNKKVMIGDIVDVYFQPHFGLYEVKYGAYSVERPTWKEQREHHFGYYLESMDGTRILSYEDVFNPAYDKDRVSTSVYLIKFGTWEKLRFVKNLLRYSLKELLTLKDYRIMQVIREGMPNSKQEKHK